jgi:hypothetical protein
MNIQYKILTFILLTVWTDLHFAYAQQSQQGLLVQDGVLTKDGASYRGIGVNYFNLFDRVLKDSSDLSYETGLRRLSEAGIPFVRFMCCGFWPVDWDLYQKDKEAYFKRLDGVIAAAEKYQVGLIPSLFWHYATVPDLCGESIDQLGNPDSKTSAFISRYTEEVVLRYKNSPAIWGWEFGNEYNLAVDLPNASEHRPPVWPQLKTPAVRTGHDELTSEQMLTAFSTFAQAVRKYDTHRILLTGNAVPRASAFHNTSERRWKKDTPEQFKSVLLRDNPVYYDILTVHLYPEDKGDYPAQAETFESLVKIISTVSKNAGKPVFVGEFGVTAALDYERQKKVFAELLSAIESQKIPLAALWVYDFTGQANEWNVTFDNERFYMLTQIADVNQKISHTPSNPQHVTLSH